MALWTWTSAAHAEEEAATRAAARKLAEDGVAALQAGDAKTAGQKLDKALQMLKAPSIALWSARALAKQGLLVESAERYLDATRLPVSGEAAVQEQAKADAQKELEQLRPRIPVLVVNVAGSSEGELSLSVDGHAIPAALVGEDQPANPGAHHVVGKRGNDEQVADVTLAEGGRGTVTLTFGAGDGGVTNPGPATDNAASPAAAGSGNPKRTLGFVALAAGGAGLVLGGVTGALAMSKHSSLEDDKQHCAPGVCTFAVEDEVKALRTFRTLSTVGFIAGGALAATGLVLVLTSSHGSEQGSATRPALALGVGVGHVELAGHF